MGRDKDFGVLLKDFEQKSAIAQFYFTKKMVG